MFRFSPGFVTAKAAAALTADSAEVEQLARAIEQLTDNSPDVPWMKVTARDPTTLEYAWTEQAFTRFAGFYDRPGGRFGTVAGLGGATVTWSPAREMNDVDVGDFPFYVKGWRSVLALEGSGSGSGYGAPIGVVYYFSAGGGDRIEIGGPNPGDSGSGSGPGGLHDWHVEILNVAAHTLTAGENIWFWNVNG